MRALVPVLASLVFACVVTASAPLAQTAPTSGKSTIAATVLLPSEKSVIGTIERFEVAARRLELATREGEHLVFVLASNAIVRVGSRTLPATALLSHRGRRAKVRYVESGSLRTAHWVAISSEPPRAASDRSRGERHGVLN